MCKEKKEKILGSVCLTVAFIVLVAANICWGRHIVDSDYATQMQLSSICAKEKSILTTSWLYGNEIRFINTQIIYGIVFLFINDWTLVRIIGNSILYVLLILSYAYLMRAVKIASIWKWFGAVCMLIPYSLVTLSIVYMSTDYMPPICLMFLFLGSYLRCAAAEEKKKRIITGGY